MKKFLLTSLLLLLPLQVFAQTSIISKDTGKQLYRIKDVGEDNDEIILGDEKSSSTYKPKITFTKWKNPKTNLPENSLSIRYDGISGTPTLSDGQIKVADTSQEFYCLPIEDGLKFGVNFLKKPATNIITFYLEGWEELEFSYQPPLNQKIKIGSQKGINIISVSDTQAIDDEGKIVASCPENVVGSYAIYHKTKRNHVVGQTNYKCGKFGHIYRPKFTDANGDWVWADLNIKDGVYTITIPQDFLDKAKYPVKANDNYGYTSIGAVQDTMYQGANAECFVSWLNTAPANGTLNYVFLALRAVTAADTIKTAVYSDTAHQPVTRLGYDTNTTTIPTTSPIVAFQQSANNYNLAITSGTDYWAGFGNNANRNIYIAFDWDGGGLVDHYFDDVTTPPATWTDYTYDSSADKWNSIYVTYTPTPSSSIKTIDGLAKASVKTVNGLAIGSVKSWDGLQ